MTSVGFDMQKFQSWTNNIAKSSSNVFQLKDVMCGIVNGITHFCIEQANLKPCCRRCGLRFESVDELVEHLTTFKANTSTIIDLKVNSQSASTVVTERMEATLSHVSDAVQRDQLDLQRVPDPLIVSAGTISGVQTGCTLYFRDE